MSDLNNPYASTPSGFSTAPAPAVGPHKSAITRLVQALIKPKAAYDGLPTEPNKTPYWVVPVLILTAISILVIIIGQDVFMGAIQDQQAKGMQQAVEQGRMTQDQADQFMSNMGNSPIFLVSFYAIALLGPILTVVISALVFWLVGRFTASEEGKPLTTFPAMLAVLGVASAVSIIESLVGSGIVLGTGSIQYGVDLQTAFGMVGQTSFLPALLKKFNLFTLWWLVVVAVGCSTLWRVRFQKAFAAVGGTWLVYTLIAVGIGAAMQGMRG